MLRQEDYCPGSRECRQANIARCCECGTEWEPEDTNFPGPCPSCKSRKSEIKRCAICTIERVIEMRATSDAGRLLARVIDADFDFRRGLSVRRDEIDIEEWNGLRVLEEERNKHAEEKRKELEDQRRRDELMRGRG